jgi:Protein of unknown function (DUF3618)
VSTPIEQDDEATRLRADIARTRARLAGSVDALTARLDVPGRVQDAASRRFEPVRRLAGTAATNAVGAATRARDAATRAKDAATKARDAATKATGVARGVARDGVGIGIALARWGAGSVIDRVTRRRDESRERGPRPATGDATNDGAGRGVRPGVGSAGGGFTHRG